MSDDAPTPATPQPQTGQMAILAQYMRSVKFENSAAIRGVNPPANPQINVQVNVDATPHGSDRFGVSLKTAIEALADQQPVFSLDLDYMGMFQLANIPEESLQEALLIGCPRVLFPFSRIIIAEVTRDGGFPPLMLDPIDFQALYKNQKGAPANA